MVSVEEKPDSNHGISEEYDAKRESKDEKEETDKPHIELIRCEIAGRIGLSAVSKEGYDPDNQENDSEREHCEFSCKEIFCLFFENVVVAAVPEDACTLIIFFKRGGLVHQMDLGMDDFRLFFGLGKMARKFFKNTIIHTHEWMGVNNEMKKKEGRNTVQN
jgi:hypothetical protein